MVLLYGVIKPHTCVDNCISLCLAMHPPLSVFQHVLDASIRLGSFQIETRVWMKRGSCMVSIGSGFNFTCCMASELIRTE